MLATEILPYIFSPQVIPQHIIVFYNPEVSCQYNCTILVIIIYVMSNMWPQHSLHVVYGTISIKWFLIEIESWPSTSTPIDFLFWRNGLHFPDINVKISWLIGCGGLQVQYQYNTFHFLSENDCNLGNPSPGMWPLVSCLQSWWLIAFKAFSLQSWVLTQSISSSKRSFELIFSNYC